MLNKDDVITKIEKDYISFKNEMLSFSAEKLFEKAYKCFCITEIYELLTDEYTFTDEQIQKILQFKGSILEQIYMEWLGVDFSHRNVFTDSVDTAFQMLP